MGLPRVITVDPTWTIRRIVRGAVDLIDRSIIQVDVPGGTEALDELKRGGAALVITAWELYDDIQGPELALRVKQAAPETAVVMLADVEDPELDEETRSESPFIYMHRPVDIQQFLRVFIAAIDGENVFEALKAAHSPVSATILDHGPLPSLDMQNARNIIKRLLVDIGAMAIVLATRTGEVLLEDGAPGYLDRDQLTNALLPMVTTTIEMSSLVGGQAQAIQFFDGDEKDVFVFSVGLHHFLCTVFDGQAGSRQFGVVNRYGRQAVQDLLALLGASAFIIERRSTQADTPRRVEHRKKATQEVEEIEPVLVRPQIDVPEPEPLKLAPIENLDVSIFDQLANLDTSAADDLFDLDKLASMSNVSSGRKEVSLDEAEELGILSSLFDSEQKK